MTPPRASLVSPLAPVLAALSAGLVFGIGLTVAQMTNPAKVLAFLDIGWLPSGEWDPSLLVVMAVGLAVSAPAFALIRRRGAALLGGGLQIPASRAIDRRLLAGALLFGAGWGLVGLCPGPAVAALALGSAKAYGFFAALVAGMLLFRLTRGGPATS